MSRRERLWLYFHTRPCLIGYVTLVIIALIAVGLYQNHVNNELDRTDKHNCEARNALARNQVLVLRTLLDIIPANDAPPGRLVELQNALANAGPREC